jgi:hypothetical protein
MKYRDKIDIDTVSYSFLPLYFEFLYDTVGALAVQRRITRKEMNYQLERIW